MIKFFDQVPTIYPSASLDFQYLGWLINIVLNSVKHNVDDLYDLPNTKMDPRLTELLAMTLGFKVKRNYDKKQLAALVSIIPSILKCKGTIKAIDMACNALLIASGVTGIARINIQEGSNCLEVMLPEDLVDITLFMDLLPYILPAGMACKIVRKTQVQLGLNTEVAYEDILRADWYYDLDLSSKVDEKELSKHYATGLATLFDVDANNSPTFAGILADNTLNEGLLSNSVIPLLTNNTIPTQLPEGIEEEQ